MNRPLLLGAMLGAMLAAGLAMPSMAQESAGEAAETAVVIPMPPALELADDLLPPASEQSAAALAAPDTAVVVDLPPEAPLSLETARMDDADLRLRIASAVAALVETARPAQKRERDAIATFYAARDNAPLWVAADALTPAGTSLADRLDKASEDGLDLADYRRPSRVASGESATSELALTQAAIAYALQASGSRIDPRSIGLITAKPVIPDVSAILAALAAADDMGTRLEAFNPPHAGYRALRDKLAELRREHPGIAEARIPAGPDLRPGMKDRRVPLLRARLGVEPESDSDPLLYDVRVASAVADFNRANGLPAVGTLTARTIAKLSGGEPLRLEAELISNMERWRWMPRDIGATRIEVNIPDYQVTVTRDGDVIHRARVIVGKPQTPTPVFSHTMQHVIVNPYWNVPVSIIKKEMMPAFAKDPTYFERRGYEVRQVRGQLVVRQPPGERNALGRIKFMFPNEHSVYLHDTSSRGLFVNARRAYSHGCVRVDNPFRLAEIVLGKDNGWSEARVRSLIGGGERLIPMAQTIPIHIQYFTAFVDDEGKLQLREDIYGYSRKVQIALGL